MMRLHLKFVAFVAALTSSEAQVAEDCQLPGSNPALCIPDYCDTVAPLDSDASGRIDVNDILAAIAAYHMSTADCGPRFSAACSTCPAGQGQAAACTATQDTTCSTCTDGSTFSVADDTGGCATCSTCPAGQGQAAACTATQDTACSTCTDGSTFSVADDTGGCTTCSTCPAGQGQAAACTATQDTTCTVISANVEVAGYFPILEEEQSAEQDVNSGEMDLDSGDLKFEDEHVIAIRFPNVDVPAGATVTSAIISFDVDEVNPGDSDADVTVSIFGEASGDPAAMSETAYDVSSRTPTTAAVVWNPAVSVDKHELLYSSDIAPVVQEIIGLDGWASGNALMILLGHVSGAGARWVEGKRTMDNGVKTPGIEITYTLGPAPAPVDCAGVPNGAAVVDACGVCDGDGSTCVCHFVTCGNSASPACVPETCAAHSELHEVRCCSDTEMTSSSARMNCPAGSGLTVWSESKFNGHAAAAANGCVHDATWETAVSVCASVPGARLCTQEEIAAFCTRGTGCGHDVDMIWTGTIGSTGR